MSAADTDRPAPRRSEGRARTDTESVPTSVTPERDTPRDLNIQDELEAAWRTVCKRRTELLEERAEYVDTFTAAWNTHGYVAGRQETPRRFPLPPTYVRGIKALHTAGLPVAELLDAVNITMTADPGPRYPARYFRYFIGVGWAKVREIRAEVLELVTAEDGGT